MDEGWKFFLLASSRSQSISMIFTTTSKTLPLETITKTVIGVPLRVLSFNFWPNPGHHSISLCHHGEVVESAAAGLLLDLDDVFKVCQGCHMGLD
jgi:hypothetical protein